MSSNPLPVNLNEIHVIGGRYINDYLLDGYYRGLYTHTYPYHVYGSNMTAMGPRPSYDPIDYPQLVNDLKTSYSKKIGNKNSSDSIGLKSAPINSVITNSDRVTNALAITNASLRVDSKGNIYYTLGTEKQDVDYDFVARMYGIDMNTGSPHRYTVDTQICFVSNPACTIDNVFHELRRNPAPYVFSDKGVESGEISLVGPFGQVKHHVDVDNKVVTNMTIEGQHRLHPGVVYQQVYQDGKAIAIRTIGVGTGFNPIGNNFFAMLLWNRQGIVISKELYGWDADPFLPLTTWDSFTPEPDFALSPVANSSQNIFPNNFNGYRYLASNSDLPQGLKSLDPIVAAKHYSDYGHNEGRSTSSFSSFSYLASYRDLIDAYTVNESLASLHYVVYGRDEGRKIIFDVTSYRAASPDLQAVFGSDLDAIARHYIQYGRNESSRQAFWYGGPDERHVGGGAGIDTISYADASAAITVDLNSQRTWNGSVGDNLSSIENAIGSRFNDTLISGSGTTRLEGRDGDDIICVVASHNITIDGGSGSDTISYQYANSRYTIDLSTQLTNNGINGDYLMSIENAIGSQFNDRMIGNAGNNVLQGISGDDFLDGLAGNDLLEGGVGADHLIGGNGDDTLRGGDGNDLIVGDNGHDVLSGDSGNDQFYFDTHDLRYCDRIIDFHPGEDKIIFQNPTYQIPVFDGPIRANMFKDVSLSPIDRDDNFIYNGNTGEVFVDLDGFGSLAAAKIAVLDNKPVLSYSDFAILSL